MSARAFRMRRVTHGRKTVIFYLADALAGDAVLPPDGIEGSGLAFAGKTETVNKHAAGALRKLEKGALL